ncbi:hypothetical protein [Acinetobacter beijerinckii]|uniref:Uncharacterized protein n=1 Tax=Acinetobacter beijerinckii CIP 110307 TaxID=1217648 RepID=N9FFL2_9GAMM|nr:hypothetical protein [Acinetobacter beijerinckii]ENW03691.1 hypothetical protein F933_03091 [Acinetobacter beijerinckii CIP 110307]
MSSSEFVLKNNLQIKLWNNSYLISPLTNILQPSKYMIILELFQPCGGRFRYGSLGAEVNIDLENSEIILDSTDHYLEKHLFQSNFLTELDEVKYGLTVEYVIDLKKFILETSNSMRFNHLYKIKFFSAYSDVGSNIKVFKFLALLILKYIQNNALTLDYINQTQEFLDQNI